MLPSTMGSLAHCSRLSSLAKNIAGAVVTNEDVGLEGFLRKESVKLVLVGI